jgi:Tfp pilus tip-associated adhesin PilY1
LNLPPPFQRAAYIRTTDDGLCYLVDGNGWPLAQLPLYTAWALTNPDQAVHVAPDGAYGDYLRVENPEFGAGSGSTIYFSGVGTAYGAADQDGSGKGKAD